MRVNEVIRSVVTSKVTACAPSSIDDEKIEALPSTRIHSGPFRIEGMEESVTFLDDGLSLLINGQVFTLQEIYVAGLRYDTTAIRDVIGAQGITGITCDDATTFQAGVNSLKITRNNFATIARRLRDGHGGVTTERELPYELNVGGVLGMILPKNGTCTLTLRHSGNAAIAPSIAKTH
jgi:hypothetical protein